MYMKVYVRRLDGGTEKESVVNCQLAEFRLLLGEIGEMGNGVN